MTYFHGYCLICLFPSDTLTHPACRAQAEADYRAEEEANTREPAPFVGPKGPDGRVLVQYRAAEYGFSEEAGW